MNEEMRKEFEAKWVELHKNSPEEIDKLQFIYNDQYGFDNVWHAFYWFSKSREAMKPIKLPKLMKNTQEQPCYYYNDAIEECKEAIQQAGYKVE